jgi:hypothetical protein
MVYILLGLYISTVVLLGIALFEVLRPERNQCTFINCQLHRWGEPFKGGHPPTPRKHYRP